MAARIMPALIGTPASSMRSHASGMKSDSTMIGTPMKCVALLRASWWYALYTAICSPRAFMRRIIHHITSIIQHFSDSMVVTHGSRASAWGRATLTIGNFDGVHRGHRALIERVGAKGRELQVPPAVLPFEPHPREFFAPERAPARLTRLRDKLELIAAAGIERVHLIRFDARFAAMSAARFIDDVLLGTLGVRWLLVGRDFRFGAQRKGDFATLQGHGFDLGEMPDVLLEGER